MSFSGFVADGPGAIQLHQPYSTQRKASTMDHEGKKAILEKMRNYPFHSIFDRRCRRDTVSNAQNVRSQANLVPHGIQSKSMGVDIFTDDVAIDHVPKGE